MVVAMLSGWSLWVIVGGAVVVLMLGVGAVIAFGSAVLEVLRADYSDDATGAGPPGVNKKGDPRCATPPWRGWRAGLFVGFTLSLPVSLLPAWAGFYPYKTSILVAGMVAWMASSVTRHLYLGRHVARLRRRVVENDRRMCLRCGYALKGSPDKHDCPECGTRYDIVATRDVWAAWLDRTPEGNPRCVMPPWRGTVGHAVVGMTVLIAVWFLVGWAGLVHPLWFFLLPQVSAPIAGSLGAYLYLGRHVKRLRRRVIEHDRRVCLRCGYALKGLPDKHECPECGTRYDIKATRDVWAAWLERNVDMDDLKTLTKSPPSNAGR